MRITNQMASNRLLTNINRNMALLDMYNTQGTTNKKIQFASDDPIIASRSLKFRTMISESEQYSSNASQATSWTDSTELVFNNMSDILVSMRENLVAASSDTYSASDRQKLLTEYLGLIEQFEQELNTDYMGRSLFSGYKTDQKPVIQDDDGNNILNPAIYGDYDPADSSTLIDGQYIEIQIGAGVTTEVNTLAPDLYNYQDYYDIRGGLATDNPLPAVAGYTYEGDTVMQQIANFMSSDTYSQMTDAEKLQWEQDADLQSIMSSMITTVDSFTSKVSVAETQTGVRSERIDLVTNRLTEDIVNYKTLMSENEDADLAEVMMNLNTANTCYQAALQIGMNLNQLSLANYI